MSKNDDLRDSWKSLGVAFYSDCEQIFSPEEAIILLVKSNEFPEDKKMMSIALAWLSKYSRFVHVERLFNMASELNEKELALLGAISTKCLGFGDIRWNKLAKKALKAVNKIEMNFESY